MTIYLTDPEIISLWLIKYDRESGLEMYDYDKLYGWVSGLLNSGKAKFVDIDGLAFFGITIEDSPYKYPIATPFGLVIDKAPNLIFRVIREIERVGREMGAEYFRLQARDERLLELYTKVCDWQVETAGSIIAHRRI